MKNVILFIAFLACFFCHPFEIFSQTLINRLEQEYDFTVLSPNGMEAAVGNQFGQSVKIINPRDNQILREFDLNTIKPGRFILRDVEFSPDAQSIAAAVEGGVIKIWDVGTGRETHSIDLDPNNLSSVGSNFLSISYSQNGKMLLFNFVNTDGRLDDVTRVINLESEQIVQTFSETVFDQGNIFPDGKRVYLHGGPNEGGAVFDITTGNQLLRIDDGIELSPDGAFIVGLSRSNGITTLTFYDADSGREIREIVYENTRSESSNVVISPDLTLLVKEIDNALVFIDLTTGDFVQQLQNVNLNSNGFSANGLLYMSGNQLFDMSNLTASVQDAQLYNN